MGKLDNRDKHNDDNDFVHKDEDLHWSDVAGAYEIGESVNDSISKCLYFRNISSSTLAKRKQFSTWTISPINEENIITKLEEEDNKGYNQAMEMMT